MKTNFSAIGKSIRRIGTEDKLTGKARYCADIELDSALVLKVLRSGRPHAEIVSIDTGEARAITGVVRIFTAADVPGRNLTGIINADQPLLAVGKVRSTADAVALVAAESEEAAKEALKKIHVEYKDLPAVFDPEQALREDAPKIHDKGNLLSRRIIRKGDVEAAFRACTSIIERTYRTPMVEHNYLEPDAGAGFVDADGTLVIYASTQNPHYDHKEVVALLNAADEKVRIVQAATGGGFGSKLDLNMQGFIGLALYHLGRPVRMVYTREEAYAATAKRHPLTIRLKTGADKSGRLLALEADILCDGGAYGSYGIAVVSRAAVHITGPYAIENVSILSREAYTNHPFCGAMRGFGTPQAAFAHETQMDLHARELGLDPLEIRLVNALHAGSETATGQVLSASVGIADCLRAVEPYYRQAESDWVGAETNPYRKRGMGIGCMFYGIGNTGASNPSSAAVEMDMEGRVTLFTGAADIGQGSTTVLVQILCETLGLRPEDVRVVAADTKYTTNAGASSASRQTYISGNAVRDAALKLCEVLKTEAVTRLRAARSSLVFENGHVAVSIDPTRRIALAALAKRAHARGEPLFWQGYFDPETVPLDPETGQGIPYAAYAFACQMALVSVDLLTGEVSVEKVVAAHDVGRAIHPENVVGQICGGVAMGLGFALMEEFRPGSTISMKDYYIPTCVDMPEVIPIIVESPEPSGPYGAKGVGEPALVATAPAITNGLADALGKEIYSLPANLERVMETVIQAGLFGPKGE